MRITQVNVHPVKSTAPRPLASARLLRRGLADDRSWVVVDGAGVIVTARELPELFTVVADTPATDAAVEATLRLCAPGAPELVLGPAGDEVLGVQLFSQSLRGLAMGAEADEWLRRVLGRDDLRLVWCDDPGRRRLNPAYAGPGDHTAFADGYPVSLASAASLRQLDQWIAEAAVERGEDVPEPLPMRRFRPNLVVDGDEPFAEDHWGCLEVGEVRFRVAKTTARCVVSTIDHRTLSTGKEPIRTMSVHRRLEGKTLFALDLLPETTGVVSVGDEVRVSAPRAAAGR